MNYDQQITNIITALKADKTVVQPLNNYAQSDLLRVQAVIRMGKNLSMAVAPQGSEQEIYHDDRCTCPDGAVDKTCPMHGGF